MRRPQFHLPALAAAAAILAAGPAAPALDSPALSIARQMNEAFVEVAEQVSSAVVVIEVTEKPSDKPAADSQDDNSWWDIIPHDHHHRHHRSEEPDTAEGSGVVITEDGYILTNNHVVDNAARIEVKFKDGRSFPAEVKGTDPESDIAVIKIKAKGLSPAKLGDSDATRVGEFVLAIGAPFALSYSVTVGHVSAKGRSFEAEETGRAYVDQDFMQTDASINPGNSGGPLVNLFGEVVGINTMIEGMNTGIGFAVPINLAKRVKDHLIAEGKFVRSWIGVEIDELRGNAEFRDLDKSIAPDVEAGVIIKGIRAKGPAAKGGLHVGDVVVGVDGKAVETARQLKDAISTQKPGQILAMNVVRVREHLVVKVKTEALPTGSDHDETPLRAGGDLPVESGTFGMSVHPITPDTAESYGVEAGSGVVVTVVDEDSVAGLAGIEPGDIIREVNHQHVTNVKQYRQAIRSADHKRGVMLEVVTEGSSRLVILKDKP